MITKAQWRDVLIRLKEARRTHGNEILFRYGKYFSSRVKYTTIDAIDENEGLVVLRQPTTNLFTPIVTRYMFPSMYEALNAFVVVKEISILDKTNA